MTYGYRVLVCGGRSYMDQHAVVAGLNQVHAVRTVSVLIEGGATGADRMAREWALSNDIPVETYHADWAAHGRGAGPRRNARMLVDGKPNFVVAFPGGQGTGNMIRLAEAAGLWVWKLS